MIVDVFQAILSLRPGSKFRMIGSEYEGIEWDDEVQTKPTKQEVVAEIARLESINEYQLPRKKSYPQIGDQLDMLWHAIDNGTLNKTSDFYTAIKAVKDTYPKSE
jgi:hypothetical protein